jgi:hypothetical protein
MIQQNKRGNFEIQSQYLPGGTGAQEYQDEMSFKVSWGKSGYWHIRVKPFFQVYLGAEEADLKIKIAAGGNLILRLLA